jgi:DNA-binding MarR family transcriptional regulator
MVPSIMAAVQDLQDATDLIDELAARRLGVNRTDLRCLSRLSARGPQTSTELAIAAGLTGGAMTTAVDRMEHAGLVQRVRDAADRRRVLVHLTDEAERLSEQIWGPIAADAQAELAALTPTELGVIERFLGVALANQRRHADRLKLDLQT